MTQFSQQITNKYDVFFRNVTLGSGTTTVDLGKDFATTANNGAFRFSSVNVPQGSVINDAVIIFKLRTPVGQTVNLNFYGNDVDSGSTFNTTTEFDSAALTSAYTSHDINTFWSGLTTVSGVITSAVQEVVDRAGWVANNPMTIMVKCPDAGGAIDTLATVSGVNATYPNLAPTLRINYSGAPAPPILGSGISSQGFFTFGGDIHHNTRYGEPDNVGYGKNHFRGETDSNYPNSALNLGYYPFVELSGASVYNKLSPTESGVIWRGTPYTGASGWYNYYINDIGFAEEVWPASRLSYRNAIKLEAGDYINFDQETVRDFTVFINRIGNGEGTIYYDGNSYIRYVKNANETYTIYFGINTPYGVVSLDTNGDVDEGLLLCGFRLVDGYGQLKIAIGGHSSQYDSWTVFTSSPFSYYGSSATFNITPRLGIKNSDINYSPAYGSFYLPSGFTGYLCEFGIANSGIDDNINTDGHPFKDLLNSRTKNYSFVQNNDDKYVDWIVPSGTAQASNNMTFGITLPTNLYEISGPPRAQYDLKTIAPSAIYCNVVLDQTSTHPSGLYINTDLVFTLNNGSTRTWYNNVRIPAGGGKTTYTIGPTGYYSNFYHPLKVSDIASTTLKLTTTYVSQPSKYDGNVKIYEIIPAFDGWYEPVISSGDTTLYTEGQNVVSSGLIDLYLYNAKQYLSTNLFIHGNASIASTGDGLNNIPLFTASQFAYTYGSGIQRLYILSNESATNTTPLYLYSPAASSGVNINYPSGVMLVTDGRYRSYNEMGLYTRGKTFPSASGDFDLYTWGALNPTLRDFQDLILYNDRQYDWRYVLPLYMHSQQFADSTSNMILFLENKDDEVNNSIDLFITTPSSINNSLDLYITTPSGTEGAVPLNSNMPLFINRRYNSDAHRLPLYIIGPSQTTNSTDMYMLGGYSGVDNNTTIYISGVGQLDTIRGFPNIKLFTHGF